MLVGILGHSIYYLAVRCFIEAQNVWKWPAISVLCIRVDIEL